MTTHLGRAQLLDRLFTLFRAMLLGCVMAVAIAGCGGSGGDVAAADPADPAGGSGGGSGNNTDDDDNGDDGDDGDDENGDDEDGSGDTAPGVPLVYIADQDTVGVYELYLADATKAGAPVKLNAPLVAGGFVDDYMLNPAGTAVAYVADQEVPGRYELYIVDLATPGSAVKVNAPLQAERDVSDFTFSPDGSRIVYRADHEENQIRQLYLVELSQPGEAEKLNAALADGGWVRDSYEFSPDGTQVVYRADQDEAGIIELYLVNIDTPGVTMQVNPELVDGGNVLDAFAFTPDGTRIGYIADQDTDEVFELYGVDVTLPGDATKLNGPLVADGDVCRFRFSPDSSRAVYCADADTAGVLELYAVGLANPGVATRLNPPLVAGGQVDTYYRISPDSSRVGYVAAQDTADVYELYLVDFDAPGASTRLNGPMAVDGNVSFFEFRADGLRLAYVADQDTDDLHELYDVNLASMEAVKLNEAPAGVGVYDFRWTPDGTGMVYVSAEDSEFADLYEVELSNPGTSTRINPALPQGGEVWEFDLLDDGMNRY